MRIASILLISIVIAGCAEPVPQRQLTDADFGPFPDQYQSAVQAYMNKSLRDPDATKYDFFMKPVHASYGRSTRYDGWAVCADINGKNAYGGYTGPRRSYFFLHVGTVIAAHHSGLPGSFDEAVVNDMCGRL